MVPLTSGKKAARKEAAADEPEWSGSGGEEQEADEDAGGDAEHRDAKDGKLEGKRRGADRVRKKPHRKPKYMRPKKKTNKQPGPLNLNNEVVNMRKEVKRVRVLIFRKMMRQITALKKKKGSEAQIEKHHRRADRLMVEIQAMKVLVPDVVTKTALQKVLDFERVCKNPKSTMKDRAIARIATHPQFKKKIDDIKAAVKAFKEERLKEAKKEEEEEEQNQDDTSAPSSPDSETKKAALPEEQDHHVAESEASTDEREEDDESLTKDETLSKSDEDAEETPQLARSAVEEKKVSGTKTVKPAKARQSQVKDVEKQKPQSQSSAVQPTVAPKPETPQTQKEEESDIESSDDEEKEYFDDSTEERFRKQSSQSEETDSDDDFFLGKVSKFKKKRKKVKSVQEEEKSKTTDQVQSQLDELESRLKSKAAPLRSAFCSSLAGSKPGGGRGAGRGAGRGESKFRGRGKQWGSSRDFGRPSNFQDKQVVEEPGLDLATSSFGRGRGRGRGRGDFAMQKHPHGGRGFTQQVPQQVLHPSWEASKKRKEQQGQILAFQGKKIKFDDD